MRKSKILVIMVYVAAYRDKTYGNTYASGTSEIIRKDGSTEWGPNTTASNNSVDQCVRDAVFKLHEAGTIKLMKYPANCGTRFEDAHTWARRIGVHIRYSVVWYTNYNQFKGVHK